MDAALKKQPRNSRRGNCLIEFSFFMPFFALLFIGIYITGVDSYALISLQSAARASAVYCSLNTCTTGTTDANVCSIALDAMRGLPNVGSSVSTCSSPVSINVAPVKGPDSPSVINAVTVTVSYTLPALANIPSVMSGLSTAQRSVEMRVAS